MLSFGTNQDCFFCRILRSFAFCGLGAGVLGFGAQFAGADRLTASYFAIAGGLIGLVVVSQLALRKKNR